LKSRPHGKKGFVIPAKSFAKIGITKILYFVTTTKYLVLSTKRLVAAAKVLVEATKKIICSYFVAVTKPFFSVYLGDIAWGALSTDKCSACLKN